MNDPRTILGDEHFLPPYKFSHRWTINNISYFIGNLKYYSPRLVSSPFSPEAYPELQFSVQLSVEVAGTKKNVSVHLKLENLGQHANLGMRVVCKLEPNVYNENINYQRRMKVQLDNPKQMFTFHSFLRVEDILEVYWSYEDVLTLTFDMDIYPEEVKLIKPVPLPFQIISSHNSRIINLKAGGRPIPVHQVFLTSRSPVFATMLSRNWLESQESQVVLSDMEWNVCKAFVRYLYQGEPLIDSFADELLSVAEKYQVFDLKQKCELHLSKSVNDDNCFHFLQLANLYQASILQQSVLLFAKRRQEQILGKVMAQISADTRSRRRTYTHDVDRYNLLTYEEQYAFFFRHVLLHEIVHEYPRVHVIFRRCIEWAPHYFLGTLLTFMFIFPLFLIATHFMLILTCM